VKPRLRPVFPSQHRIPFLRDTLRQLHQRPALLIGRVRGTRRGALGGLSFDLFAPLLDVLVEHHEVLAAPLNIHKPFVVRARAAEDGDCFACGHHDGDTITAVDGFDSEGLDEETEMLAGKQTRSLTHRGIF
jgi:hypothetical protein